MRKRWMRIIEQGNDPDLGTALVRLAERAAEMHRAEFASPADRADNDVPGPAGLADDPHRLTRESDR